MTLTEIKATYGLKKYVTSPHENLVSIVDRLYEDRSPIYSTILQSLNTRFDWDDIAPGSTIYYLPKYACSKWSEYYSRW